MEYMILIVNKSAKKLFVCLSTRCLQTSQNSQRLVSCHYIFVNGGSPLSGADDDA